MHDFWQINDKKKTVQNIEQPWNFFKHGLNSRLS